jgi:hypothetical protein
LNAAVNIFDAICGQPLLPFHEIDKDTVRHELDRQFGRDVLGLDASLLATGGALDILRLKLSKEPSIRGKK